MKRVLIASGHLNVGGVEKSLVNLLKSIDYSKYSVDLILFEGLGDYLPDIPKEVRIINCDLRDTYGSLSGVVKKNISHPKTVYRKIILTLANKINPDFIGLILKHDSYDVAIAYKIGTPLDFVSYGVKAKKKCFWWHHGEYYYSDHQTHIWQKAANNIGTLVCVSESVRKIVEPVFGRCVKSIEVVPNSLDLDEIRHKAEQNNPCRNDVRNIVSVGRFSIEKHIADCVMAAEKMIERGIVDFHWYLIGDGHQWEEINSLIHTKNLTDYFTCTGSITNPYPYMNNADLIVHPSYTESQGITVLEAMALGKSIVSVGSDGVLTFAKDGINAIIADKNLDSLVDSIEKALSMNEDQTFMMQHEAIKTAQNYSNEIIWKKVEDMLTKDE